MQESIGKSTIRLPVNRNPWKFQFETLHMWLRQGRQGNDCAYFSANWFSGDFSPSRWNI